VSGEGQKIEVRKYYADVGYFVGHGTPDAVLEVNARQKTIWSGTEIGGDHIGMFPVNNINLFGGNLSEGGVFGEFAMCHGGPSQILPDGLAKKHSSANHPVSSGRDCWAYRNALTVFFSGPNWSDEGFYWSTAKQIPPVDFRVRYGASDVLNPANAAIPVLVDLTSDTGQFAFAIAGLTGKPLGNFQDYNLVYNPDTKAYELVITQTWMDVNPAHAIYKTLTDEWGAQRDPSEIDTASFLYAASVLFSENFGITAQYKDEDSAFEFIQKITQQIQGYVYESKSTGLLTLKLVRGDYTIDDSTPRFVDDNCQVQDFQRKLANAINEVKIDFTNPKGEKKQTVTIQSSADIGRDGVIRSTSIAAPFIRSATLASFVAARELRNATASLCSVVLRVSNAWWFIEQGDVVLWSDTQRGIFELPMRVRKVDDDNSGRGYMELTLGEDVFSKKVGHYYQPQKSLAPPPANGPTPADFTYVFTLPAYFAARIGDPGEGAAYLGVLAATKASASVRYNLMAESGNPDGSTGSNTYDGRAEASHAILATNLAAEPLTDTMQFAQVFKSGANANTFVLIGEDEATQEIALVYGFDAAGFKTIRGVMDTVPRAWPAGTVCWYLNPDGDTLDRTRRGIGTVGRYKVLPVTILGQLDPSVVGYVSGTVTERPHQPLRPANVQVNGIGFGSATVDGTADVPVTWATRNRFMEDNQVLAWTEGPVAPEDGVTTRITIRQGDTILKTYDALTGNTFSIPKADLTFAGATVRVEAYRAGDDTPSLQAHEIFLKVLGHTGYGNGYGLD
jgi:hypothetical protein